MSRLCSTVPESLMQALKSKGNKGLEATTVARMCNPNDRTFPIKNEHLPRTARLGRDHGQSERGRAEAGASLLDTEPGCFTRAFPAYQVLCCIQTFSHVAAGTDTAYRMLREGGSNLLYCSCQKPPLVYVMKAPERQNIPKTTLLKLATPETTPSCLWMAGLKEAKQRKQEAEKPPLALQCDGPAKALYNFSWLLLASPTVNAEGETGFQSTDAKCYLRTKYWFTMPQHLPTTFTVCNTFIPMASL